MRYFFSNYVRSSLWMVILMISCSLYLLHAAQPRIDRVLPSETSLYNRALLAECLDFLQVVLDQSPKTQYSRVLELDGQYFNTVRYTADSALTTSYLPHRYYDEKGGVTEVSQRSSSPYFDMDINYLLDNYAHIDTQPPVPMVFAPGAVFLLDSVAYFHDQMSKDATSTHAAGAAGSTQGDTPAISFLHALYASSAHAYPLLARAYPHHRSPTHTLMSALAALHQQRVAEAGTALAELFAVGEVDVGGIGCSGGVPAVASLVPVAEGGEAVDAALRRRAAAAANVEGEGATADTPLQENGVAGAGALAADDTRKPPGNAQWDFISSASNSERFSKVPEVLDCGLPEQGWYAANSGTHYPSVTAAAGVVLFPPPRARPGSTHSQAHASLHGTSTENSDAASASARSPSTPAVATSRLFLLPAHLTPRALAYAPALANEEVTVELASSLAQLLGIASGGSDAYLAFSEHDAVLAPPLPPADVVVDWTGVPQLDAALSAVLTALTRAVARVRALMSLLLRGSSTDTFKPRSRGRNDVSSAAASVDTDVVFPARRMYASEPVHRIAMLLLPHSHSYVVRTRLPNYDLAAELLQSVAAYGDADAQYLLGHLYDTGVVRAAAASAGDEASVGVVEAVPSEAADALAVAEAAVARSDALDTDAVVGDSADAAGTDVQSVLSHAVAELRRNDALYAAEQAVMLEEASSTVRATEANPLTAKGVGHAPAVPMGLPATVLSSATVSPLASSSAAATARRLRDLFLPRPALAPARALSYMTAAALGGSVEAQLTLAFQHLSGHGTPASCNAAAIAYSSLASGFLERHPYQYVADSALTQYEDKVRLEAGPGGIFRLFSLYGGEDEVEGVGEYFQFHLQQMLANGDEKSINSVAAILYHGGMGVQRDVPRALALYQHSAQRGNLAAAAALVLHALTYHAPLPADAVQLLATNITPQLAHALVFPGHPLYAFKRTRPPAADELLQTLIPAESASERLWDTLIEFFVLDEDEEEAPTANTAGASASASTSSSGATSGSGPVRRGSQEVRDAQTIRAIQRHAKTLPAAAVYATAFLHLHGLGGVTRDRELAHTMLLAAAEMGSVAAVYQLGILYLHGDATPYVYAGSDGVPPMETSVSPLGIKSYTVALQLLSKAANSGHHKAMYNLGQMYLHGVGVPQSCDLAVKLLKTVAEQQYLRLARGDYLLPAHQPAAHGQTSRSHVRAEVMRPSRWGVSAVGEPAHDGVPDVHRVYVPVRRGATMARRALSMARRGRYNAAWYLYSQLALMGLETAQSNAAWTLRFKYSAKYRGGRPLRLGDEAAAVSALSAAPLTARELIVPSHTTPLKLIGGGGDNLARQSLLPRWLHEQYTAFLLGHPRLHPFTDPDSHAHAHGSARSEGASAESSLGVASLPFAHAVDPTLTVAPVDTPLSPHVLSSRSARHGAPLSRGAVAVALARELGVRLLARLYGALVLPVDAVEALLRAAAGAVSAMWRAAAAAVGDILRGTDNGGEVLSAVVPSSKLSPAVAAELHTSSSALSALSATLSYLYSLLLTAPAVPVPSPLHQAHLLARYTALAAEQGNVLALRHLADMAYYGAGGVSDMAVAVKAYKQALALGDALSGSALAYLSAAGLASAVSVPYRQYCLNIGHYNTHYFHNPDAENNMNVARAVLTGEDHRMPVDRELPAPPLPFHFPSLPLPHPLPGDCAEFVPRDEDFEGEAGAALQKALRNPTVDLASLPLPPRLEAVAASLVTVPRVDYEAALQLATGMGDVLWGMGVLTRNAIATTRMLDAWKLSAMYRDQVHVPVPTAVAAARAAARTIANATIETKGADATNAFTTATAVASVAGAPSSVSVEVAVSPVAPYSLFSVSLPQLLARLTHAPVFAGDTHRPLPMETAAAAAAEAAKRREEQRRREREARRRDDRERERERGRGRKGGRGGNAEEEEREPHQFRVDHDERGERVRAVDRVGGDTRAARGSEDKAAPPPTRTPKPPSASTAARPRSHAPASVPLPGAATAETQGEHALHVTPFAQNALVTLLVCMAGLLLLRQRHIFGGERPVNARRQRPDDNAADNLNTRDDSADEDEGDEDQDEDDEEWAADWPGDAATAADVARARAAVQRAVMRRRAANATG